MNIGNNSFAYKKLIYQNPALQTQKTPESEKKDEIQKTPETKENNKITNIPPQQIEPATPPEVVQLMQSLGLKPTNSKEGDKAAIDSKLATLEAKATGPAQLNEVKSLRSIWAEISTNAASGGKDSAQKENSAPNINAMDQMAMQNRMFFKL